MERVHGPKNADKPSKVYKFAAVGMKTVYAAVPGLKLTSSGIKNLPDRGPYLLAFTHHNSWDVPAVGSTIYEEFGRPVYFMTDQEIMDGKFGKILRTMHGVPIKRLAPSHNQIRSAVTSLKKGHILGMAPEGERINGNEIGELKGGVGFIACKSNVMVVPAGIAGKNFGQLGSKSAYLPRPLHIHFSEAFAPGGPTRDDAANLDERLRPELQASLDEAYRQYDNHHGTRTAARLNR